MNKCEFCNSPCNQDWCSTNDPTIEQSHEVGKVIGAKHIILKLHKKYPNDKQIESFCILNLEILNEKLDKISKQVNESE